MAAKRQCPNWDAIGRLRFGPKEAWLLVEAKANIEELRSSSKASSHGGRPMVEAFLARTRERLGAATDHDWLSGYYQFCNRLAVLDLLNEHSAPAHLLACARHLDDLSSAGDRGLRFDLQAAQHAIDFFGFLRHSKGEWAGETFVLAPWQAFVGGSLFGWQRADGLRRFRTAYCAVPRKNGKSTLSAGIALYLLVADGEQGAEIYSAATTRDQARIVFDEAKRMVGSSPALKRRVQVLINNLNVEASASRFMPLSSDASSMDGLNVHGAIIDELHAHRTRHVVDVLETATGARRQPLLFEITTAGYDRHSICFEHHDYAIKLLEGVLQDDSWFAFIAAADEDDDWTDPEVWRKANPSFGISVKADDLARKAEKAIALPGAQNAFRRMHLNEWTEQAERWIDMAAWDACSGPVDLEALRGRSCFGGLDLSTTTDVTALAWVFPPDDDDGLWYLLSRYFVPEDNLRKRAERDRVPYDLWTRQGFIEATPGNVVDYGAIEQRILADSALFQVREIAYNPWNATHIALRLQDEGATMVEFRQGFRSMAAPTRELEKLIVSKKLAHGGNPVTRWMAANVAVAQDPAGNLKPAKDKSTERIDGIVALIMAIGRALVAQEEPQPEYSMFFV